MQIALHVRSFSKSSAIIYSSQLYIVNGDGDLDKFTELLAQGDSDLNPHAYMPVTFL